MKKTITLILALTLMLGLFTGCGEKAKETTPSAGDTANPNAGGNTGANTGDLQSVYVQQTMERYDEDGRLDDCWTKEYDANGNMIKMTESGYIHTFTYDANNRMTDRLVTRADGSTYLHYTYQYDENGNQTLRTEDYSEYYYEYTSTYNDQGLRTQEVCTQNGEHFRTDTYSYDEQGRVVDYVEGTMSRTHYLYTDNTTTEQDVSDDGSRVYEYTVYTYDANGKLLKEEFFADGELEDYDEYTRDASGNALEKRSYSVDDGEAELDRRIVYTYDENGNLTEKNIYENDALSRRLVYTYIQLQVSPQRAQEIIAQAQKDAD